MSATRTGGCLLPLALLFVAVSPVGPPAASAGDLTWVIKNSYGHKVQVSFYTPARSLEWPGPGRAFNLGDHATHTYHLTCVTGEQVCFGAWSRANSRVYWGVGADHAHACDRCCYLCDGGETAQQILD